jgi:dihydrofolate reductase
MQAAHTTGSFMKAFDIIVAYDRRNGGIGYQENIPWNLKNDMRYFRRVTTNVSECHIGKKQNAVIMGRRTWESLQHKPLRNRVNIIVSNTMKPGSVVGGQVVTVPTLYQALLLCNIRANEIESVFVIGGEQLYKEAILHPWLRYVYVSEVVGMSNEQKYDAYFPHELLMAHIFDNTFAVDVIGVVKEENLSVIFKKYFKIKDLAGQNACPM